MYVCSGPSLLFSFEEFVSKLQFNVVPDFKFVRVPSWWGRAILEFLESFLWGVWNPLDFKVMLLVDSTFYEGSFGTLPVLIGHGQRRFCVVWLMVRHKSILLNKNSSWIPNSSFLLKVLAFPKNHTILPQSEPWAQVEWLKGNQWWKE